MMEGNNETRYNYPIILQKPQESHDIKGLEILNELKKITPKQVETLGKEIDEAEYFEKIIEEITGSSGRYFIWILQDEQDKKEKFIRKTKESSCKTSEINMNNNEIYDSILQNLDENFINKMNESNDEQSLLLFKENDEYNNFFNMIVGCKMGLNPDKFIYKFKRKEFLYALLLISEIYKNNPNLDNEKIQLILHNYKTDDEINIYSIFSILQNFFEKKTKYNFLANCKFIMFDTPEGKEATKYLRSNIGTSTKDRISIFSEYYKI